MGNMVYNRTHTKTYLLRFHYKTDKDIIEKMDSLENKVGYIKRLIREDMKHTGNAAKPFEPEPEIEPEPEKEATAMVNPVPRHKSLRVRIALKVLEDEPDFSDFDASPNFPIFRELCELLNVDYPYDPLECKKTIVGHDWEGDPIYKKVPARPVITGYDARHQAIREEYTDPDEWLNHIVSYGDLFEALKDAAEDAGISLGKLPTARISVDNGANFVTPAEAIQDLTWEAIVSYLNDELQERVHAELDPCTESEFLTRYLELSPSDLVID